MDQLRYCASLGLIAFALAGMLLGGAGAWVGIIAFATLAIIDNQLPADYRSRTINHRWLIKLLPYLHYPALFGLWMVFGWQLGQGNISGWHLLGGIISVGFINGAVGLATAHELMHGGTLASRTGADLIGTCYGVPVTDLGHVHVHHLHLDTPADGDTPLRGESLYRFVARSVVLQIVGTFKLEFEHLQKVGRSPWSPRSRVFWGLVFELLFAGCFITLAGIIGLPVLIITWVLGFTIMADYNYVQHYGLVRVPGTPIEARHAWNHLKPLSRVISYEITTHSEHHLDAHVPYYALTPLSDAPQMPSVLLSFFVTFIPPLWDRYVAVPRLKQWDEHFASPQEQALARQANDAAGWSQWLPAELS
ncbi:MAG: fatty acid desaturase [Immundisolibacteraceae bacterium]|nr:fatty acid desaturase [Immundisolibacteraceae bacterium]